MKIFLSFLFALLLATTEAQQLDWVLRFATEQMQSLNPIIVKKDKLGFIWVSGTFSGENIDFDPGRDTFYMTSNLPFNTYHDVFFAKYDSQGNFLWAKKLTNQNSSISIHGMEIDSSGNLYLAGSYSSYGFDVDPGVDTTFLNNLGYGDLFIAKYDFNGNLIQAASISDTLREIYLRLAIDKKGDIIVWGNYEGSVDVNLSDSITAIVGPATSFDMFLTKYDSNLNLKWVVEFRSNTSSYPGWMTLDDNNNIFLIQDIDDSSTTYIKSNGIFTPIFTSTSDGGYYYMKLNSNGELQWLKSINSDYIAYARIIFDKQGNIYHIGHFQSLVHFPFNLNHIGPTDFDPGVGNTNTYSKGKGDLFIAKYDSLGNFIWVKHFGNLNPNPVASASVSGFSYGLLNDSTFLIIGNFNLEELDINPDATIIQNLFTKGEDDGLVACFNLNGELIWAHGIGGNDSDYLFGGVVDGENNFIISGYSFSQNIDCDLGPNVYSLSNNGGNLGSFLIKYSQKEYNTIQGKVFFDADSNGIQNGSEPALKDLIISTSPGVQYSLTDTYGRYYSYADTGSYSVEVSNLSSSIKSIPVSHSASFSNFAQQSPNKDFAIVPIGKINEIEISLTNWGKVSPGFPAYYDISFKNTGNTVLSGNIEVVFDHHFQNIYSLDSLVILVNDSTLRFDYADLWPFQSKNFEVKALVDSSAVIGDTALIKVANDSIYSLWSSIWIYQKITGAYDPNDKICQPEILYTNALGEISSAIDYTVRFQNTGNDTAFTVVIIDTLSDMLDVSSLQLISSSHSYELQILSGNILKFTFPNILLPDSNVNEPKSHGFIKFKLKPKSSVMPDNIISNTAYIYFDYNEPIITNTTTTLIELPTNINVTNNKKQSLNIYPNPFNEFTIIELGCPKNCLSDIKIYDAYGKLIKEIVNYNGSKYLFKRQLLSSGLYFVFVQNNTIGLMKGKMIIN